LFIRHQYVWIKIKKIDIGFLCVNRINEKIKNLPKLSPPFCCDALALKWGIMAHLRASASQQHFNFCVKTK
jgi:hypothetical protein